MADDPAKALLKMAIAWLAVIAALLVLGVTVSMKFAGTIALVFFVIAIVAARDDQANYFSRDISIPFVLSAIGILAILAEFVLPDWIVDNSPDVGAIVGIPFAELDAVRILVTTVLAILVIWALEIRFTGRAVKPSTVAKRMKTKAEKLVDTYLTIGRLIAAFGLVVIFMAARQAAQFLGEAGGWFAEVPFIASSVGISLSGYLSLGGTLPVVGSVPLIGGLSALDFAVFAMLAIGLAAAVKYND